MLHCSSMILFISLLGAAVVLGLGLYWFDSRKLSIWCTTPAVLQNYAKDVSVFKKKPKGVAYPKNTDDVVALVKEVQTLHKTDPDASLTVRAGGTCMSGGPLGEGYIIDMTKYMTSVSVDPLAKTATVEMGAYFRDLERQPQNMDSCLRRIHHHASFVVLVV